MSIFRAYDIRGEYPKDINEGIAKTIGSAFARFAGNDKNYNPAVFVARDARLSSPYLSEKFIEGCQLAGTNVFDLGMIPRTVACFYAWKSQGYLAYITASHLPKEWNGIKFFTPEGIGFLEKQNMEIKRLYSQETNPSKRQGTVTAIEKRPVEQYTNLMLFKSQPKKKLKIVTDAGNGVADIVLKDLLKKAGHSVTSLNSKPDGNFPNRKVDPNEDSLKLLRDAVIEKEADLGLAFDGDADRLTVVDDKGRKLSADHLAYILLKEIYKTKKGPAIANVECSYVIDEISKQFNEKVIRVPVGDTHLIFGVNEHKGIFGIEKSGHCCIPSLVPFDDAIATAYFLSCILEEKVSDSVKTIPSFFFNRINIPCTDDLKAKIMDSIKKDVLKKFGAEKTSAIDGIRINFDNSWVLIRQSNTSPFIRITIESKTKEDLQKLEEDFTKLVNKHII
ncbi:MAG: hypothetical protein HZB65_00155 [Candidatus Aenigmarchaeota archaeon]|nr:hypothetical protein [Candidatus Aenigmarchaeota archaeon]